MTFSFVNLIKLKLNGQTNRKIDGNRKREGRIERNKEKTIINFNQDKISV